MPRKARARRVGDASGKERAKTLDDTFLFVLLEIERKYKDLPKFLRIRAERWIQKLSEPCANLLWKKSRNDYAALLMRMISEGDFKEPFNRLPKPGPLQSLPPYMALSIHQPKPSNRRQFWSKVFDRVSQQLTPDQEEASATGDAPDDDDDDDDAESASAGHGALLVEHDDPLQATLLCPTPTKDQSDDASHMQRSDMQRSPGLAAPVSLAVTLAGNDVSMGMEPSVAWGGAATGGHDLHAATPATADGISFSGNMTAGVAAGHSHTLPLTVPRVAAPSRSGADLYHASDPHLSTTIPYDHTGVAQMKPSVSSAWAAADQTELSELKVKFERESSSRRRSDQRVHELELLQQTQVQRITALEEEVETQRHLKENERHRLVETHENEIATLRRVHREEMDAFRRSRNMAQTDSHYAQYAGRSSANLSPSRRDPLSSDPLWPVADSKPALVDQVRATIDPPFADNSVPGAYTFASDVPESAPLGGDGDESFLSYLESFQRETERLADEMGQRRTQDRH